MATNNDLGSDNLLQAMQILNSIQDQALHFINAQTDVSTNPY